MTSHAVGNMSLCTALLPLLLGCDQTASPPPAATRSDRTDVEARAPATGSAPASVDPTREIETMTASDAAAKSALFEAIEDQAIEKFVPEYGIAQRRCFLPEIMGGGVAVFDADGDDDLDIYLVNGHDDFPGALTSTTGVTNRLFKQRKNGTFTDATEPSGLGDPGYGMGAAVGDCDNDGDLDLFVTNFGTSRLYRNEGGGRYVDVSTSSGALVEGWATSAAFVDFDHDGWLDLYVCRYMRWNSAKICTDSAGVRNFCGPRDFPPESDVLLHNEGGGIFRDVSAASGITRARATGLGVVCDDFNGDGLTDIYVANDGYANQLWMNLGNGVFRDEALMRGSALNMSGVAEAGMGLIAADLDGDVDRDLYVTHLTNETNTFFRNLGDNRGFIDDTARSGLGAGTMPWTGFGVAAIDPDLDGWQDVIVANGKVFNAAPHKRCALEPPFNLLGEPNLFQRNLGGGRFQVSEEHVAALTDPVEISRGCATGDLDRDGDLDVVISQVGSPARLFRTRSPTGRNFLTIRAVDPALNRDAYGAIIELTAGGRKRSDTIQAATSYLSSKEPICCFGLGEASNVDALVVQWPGGQSESFDVPRINVTMTLVRGTGQPAGKSPQ